MALTDFGDSAVLLAIVLATGGYLWACGYRRGALGLIFSLLFAVAGITAAKLIFLSCSAELYNLGISSPSGHAALSTAVLGTLAFVMGCQLSGRWRFVPSLLALAIVTAICVTRVMLDFHTVAEVAVGLITGIIVLIVEIEFLLRDRQKHPDREPMSPRKFAFLILITAATACIFHGERLPGESMIRTLAISFKSFLPICND